MIFDLCLTEEDYIAFCIYHQFHSPQNRKYLLLSRLTPFILSVLLLLLLLLISGASPRQIWPEAAILLGLSAFSFFLYPGRLKNAVRRRIEKTKAEGKLPYEAEETVEFTDDQIIAVTDHSERKIPYTEIAKICADEAYIFLYTGVVQSIILPFRCLGDQKDALLALLREKTGKDIA